MFSKIYANIKVSAATAAILAVLSSPAVAGFEWVPAHNTKAPVVEEHPPAMQMKTAPNYQFSEDGMLDKPVVQMKHMGQSNVAVVEEKPQDMNVVEEPVQMQKSVVSTAPIIDYKFANAVGFGENMPLALALGQVVPSDFVFAFDQGVNPGAFVSWNGGMAWNQVVLNMIEPLGYLMHLHGSTVTIHNPEMSGDLVPMQTLPSFDSTASEVPTIIAPAAGEEKSAPIIVIENADL